MDKIIENVRDAYGFLETHQIENDIVSVHFDTENLDNAFYYAIDAYIIKRGVTF